MVTLITAVDKDISLSLERINIVPKGTKGEVIHIIIDNGKASFLLDFPEYGGNAWYKVNEVEENCY